MWQPLEISRQSSGALAVAHINAMVTVGKAKNLTNTHFSWINVEKDKKNLWFHLDDWKHTGTRATLQTDFSVMCDWAGIEAVEVELLPTVCCAFHATFAFLAVFHTGWLQRIHLEQMSAANVQQCRTHLKINKCLISVSHCRAAVFNMLGTAYQRSRNS